MINKSVFPKNNYGSRENKQVTEVSFCGWPLSFFFFFFFIDKELLETNLVFTLPDCERITITLVKIKIIWLPREVIGVPLRIL